MRSIFSFYRAHRELLVFVVTGVITTAVNWVIYSLLVSLCGMGINISNVFAWLFSVIVAFFLNKAFVFQRLDWHPSVVLREGVLFFGSRLLSGAVEIGLVPVLMEIGVTQSILGVKGFVAKFFASGVATVLSFFLSKYGVFQKKEPRREDADTVSVEYHADDYGLFPAQSRRILRCYEDGVLSAISVMPNSPYLSQCIEQLPPWKKLATAVHLNLMEGHSISAPERIPLLVNRDGIFSVTFGKLLLASYLPGRRAWRAQLRKELGGQLHTVSQYLEKETPLRIDGHAHYHMLPVVFDALMDVIQTDHLQVSYIRFPQEHLRLYWKNRSRLTGFRPINLVKVLVLNVLVHRNRRKYHAFTSQLEQRVFLGVFLSGNMCTQNVTAVLPSAKALAQRLQQGLEILAHPGGVYESEDIVQLTHKDDVTFLNSENRNKELEMFQKIRENEGSVL